MLLKLHYFYHLLNSSGTECILHSVKSFMAVVMTLLESLTFAGVCWISCHRGTRFYCFQKLRSSVNSSIVWNPWVHHRHHRNERSLKTVCRGLRKKYHKRHPQGLGTSPRKKVPLFLQVVLSFYHQRPKDNILLSHVMVVVLRPLPCVIRRNDQVGETLSPFAPKRAPPWSPNLTVWIVFELDRRQASKSKQAKASNLLSKKNYPSSNNPNGEHQPLRPRG
jgi:hypothetical protein